VKKFLASALRMAIQEFGMRAVDTKLKLEDRIHTQFFITTTASAALSISFQDL
jgi:hypothetical protein